MIPAALLLALAPTVSDTLPETPPLPPWCETVADLTERRQCAEGELVRYLYENFRFPNPGTCAAGTVVVRFVVLPDGRIDSIGVLRSVHPAYAAEVMRLLCETSPWTAGIKGGTPVQTTLTLPFRIELE